MTVVRCAVVGHLPVLDAAQDWYADVSGGRAVVIADRIDGGAASLDWSAFAGRGGLGAAPMNSQGLAAAVLAGVDRRAVARVGGLVLIATPAAAGFAPHTWRHRGGGVWLGGRDWSRRYAVVPADAPLGTVVHELGHLLFGWADHDRRSGLGTDCLMGTGAAARSPAAPCAPTRVAAGWTEPVPAMRSTTVAVLARGRVLSWGTRLIELGPSGDVLVYDGVDLVGRARVEPDRPLLAALPLAR